MKTTKIATVFILCAIVTAIASSFYLITVKSQPHSTRVIIPYAGSNQSFQVNTGSGIGYISKNGYELLTVTAQQTGKTTGYECENNKVSFSNQAQASGDVNRHWLLPPVDNSPKISVERQVNGEMILTLDGTQADTMVAFSEKISNKSYRLKDESWVLWGKKDTSTENEAIYTQGLKISINRSYCAQSTPMVQAEFYAEPTDKASENAVKSSSAILLNTSTGVMTRRQYPLGASKIDFLQYEEQTLLSDAIAQKVVSYNPSTDTIVTLPEGTGVYKELDSRGTLAQKLYHSDNGQYVNQQIREFNEQNYAGLRIHAVSAEQTQELSDPSRWKIYTTEKAYANQAFEDKLYRHISDAAVNFGSWQFTRSESAGTYHFETNFPQSLKNTTIEIFTMGKISSIDGASIQSEQSLCDNGVQCNRYQLLIQSPHLNIQVQSTKETKTSSNVLTVHGSDMTIKPAKLFSAHYIDKPNNINISDQSGQLLFTNQEPTELAWGLNLAGLVGLTPTDGLRYVFNASAPEGTTEQNAQLTINSSMQATAVKVLNCVGQNDGDWQSMTQQCANMKPVPEKRESSMIIMDSVTGEILTATNGTIVPKTGAYKELAGYSRYHPSHSALIQKSWSHDGGFTNMPGSSFKLVTSMALEKKSTSSPILAQDLGGNTVEQLNISGQPFNFSMNSLCYPMDCTKKVHLSNPNDRENQPNSSGTYGIVEALLHSSNTWFAYMTERNFATQFDARVRSMAVNSLDENFPLHSMAHQLGFEQPLRLDGELMVERLPANSVLETTPSTFDPMLDTHSLRQMAIGLRMHVTPIQMARVAGVIATGQLTQPYLIGQLNGEKAQTRNIPIRGISFEYIRSGMNAVVTIGTAKTAFSEPAFDSMRSKIYAKTGTADIEGKSNNVAWLVGYLDVGAIAGQQHPLAFAIKVSDTDKDGGKSAAKVLAAWLQSINSAK